MITCTDKISQFKYKNHGNEQFNLCFAKGNYIESDIGKETDNSHTTELCYGCGIVFDNKHL